MPMRTPEAALRRRIVRALLVPLVLATLATAGSPGWGSYVIRHGDTLSDVAHRYSTTVAALVAANDLPGNGNRLYAGEAITVPVTAKAARASRAAHQPTARHRPDRSSSPRHRRSTRRTVVTYQRHTVVAGDSVIRLAHRYHSTTALIVKANRLRASRMVVIGRTLSIPVRVTKTVGRSVTRGRGASPGTAAARGVPTTFAGRTYPDAVAFAAARNRAALAHRSLPSKARIRSMIIRTARRNGLDPSIALAVAWQESGWSQRHVSPANAIGAMQVIPSTGDWASSIVGRRLDLLDPADNITAGVVLLKVLTRSANLEDAIGGYYQGLASVRRNGSFADTKVYVTNVLLLRETYR